MRMPERISVRRNLDAIENRSRYRTNNKNDQTNPFRCNPMRPILVQRNITFSLFSFLALREEPRARHSENYGHARDSNKPAPCGKMTKRTHFAVSLYRPYWSDEFSDCENHKGLIDVYGINTYFLRISILTEEAI